MRASHVKVQWSDLIGLRPRVRAPFAVQTCGGRCDNARSTRTQKTGRRILAEWRGVRGPTLLQHRGTTMAAGARLRVWANLAARRVGEGKQAPCGSQPYRAFASTLLSAGLNQSLTLLLDLQVWYNRR